MLYNDPWLSLNERPKSLEIILHSAEVGPPTGDFQPVRILTSRGTVEGRLYAVTRARQGVVLAGGGRGTWDGPAHGLYPRLGAALRHRAIPTLRVGYRDPTSLDECVLDVLAAVGFLESERIHAIALVGHDVGGPVVMRAAAVSPAVRAVATLAPQSDRLHTDEIRPECPLLLIHGTDDDAVPPAISTELAETANQPNRLALYSGAGQRLGEVAHDVYTSLLNWLIGQFRGRSTH
jgi:pimeloyl-ACP methyl ester carboxylesterase